MHSEIYAPHDNDFHNTHFPLLKWIYIYILILISLKNKEVSSLISPAECWRWAVWLQQQLSQAFKLLDKITCSSVKWGLFKKTNKKNNQATHIKVSDTSLAATLLFELFVWLLRRLTLHKREDNKTKIFGNINSSEQRASWLIKDLAHNENKVRC